MVEFIAVPAGELPGYYPGLRFPDGSERIVAFIRFQAPRYAAWHAERTYTAGLAQEPETAETGIGLRESYQPKEEGSPMNDTFEFAGSTEAPALDPKPLLPAPLGEDRTLLIRHGLDLVTRWCHTASVEAGWWHDPKTGAPRGSVPEKLALIHSEISEALEGDRKSLRDEKLPHRWAVEVELADALIRIFDLAGALALDLGGAVEEKLEYNAHRSDHKTENRALTNGKAY